MLSQLFFYELGGNDEIIGENCQMALRQAFY